MREGHHKVAYRIMPSRSRFGWFFALWYHESCYTHDELQFRKQVLRARAASAMDAELLQGSSWFHDDDSSAFINVNAGSWVKGEALEPQHRLGSDDFHINLVPADRLVWGGLSTLMRTIGDYLLLRNKQLAPEHYNQPMNYVLLDAVRMLRQLAMIDNADYVSTQLQLMQQYLRVIEIHVLYFEGSDRLFLADCRSDLQQIADNDIRSQIQSRQLKHHFMEIKRQLNRVGEMRHTLLHYAFSGREVNPHPYWETFAEPQALASHATFPVLAAKSCAGIVTAEVDSGAPGLAPLMLDNTRLAHCPDLSFITLVGEQTQTAYGQCVMDLQEILRFQSILDQLIHLFDQAGDAITRVSFREQMTDLLQTMEQFIQRSQQPVHHVLEANTRAYYQYMHDEQDMSLWEQWLGSKPAIIRSFIINQDNLARFAATSDDFQAANQALTEQVHQVLNQLNQQRMDLDEQQLLQATRRQMDALMRNMHVIVNHQRAVQGLPYEARPRSLLTDERPVLPVGNRLLFWSQEPASPPALSAGPVPDVCVPELEPVNAWQGTAFLAMILAIPLVFLGLYLFYRQYAQAREDDSARVSEPQRYEAFRIMACDSLTLCLHQDDSLPLQDYQETLQQLESEARNGFYDARAMKKLARNLTSYQRELEEEVCASNSK